MRKVVMFSGLLGLGLFLSQVLPRTFGDEFASLHHVISLITYALLAYIMVGVGLEFELDKSRLRSYGVDYGVAMSAAALPWIFCVLYFWFVMVPPELRNGHMFLELLLIARFASPTSAGILFSMLSAAGLSDTWVYKKAKVLAVLDDLDTVLLMVPLTMLLIGFKFELVIIVGIMGALLAIGWRKLHSVNLPYKWYWRLGYAISIVLIIEIVADVSTSLGASVPIHIEVLLPAFCLGLIMKQPHNVHVDDRLEEHQDGELPNDKWDALATTAISATFMLFVGLSMPVIGGGEIVHAIDGAAGHSYAADIAQPGLLLTIFHVGMLTLLSNLGKCFLLLTYKKEADFKARLALAIGMWPRGEVGAGVLVISLGYGISGPLVTVATLTLALNLMLTGIFILAVRWLIARSNTEVGHQPIPAIGD